MSFLNSLNGYLDIPNANLRVNGSGQFSSINVGSTRILAGYDLDTVTSVGSITPYTIEFSNATTGIVTTSNGQIGGDLTVLGNAAVSSNLTVAGNATISSNLTVAGNATVSSNLNVAGNTTVAGNATVSSNLTVAGNTTVAGNATVSSNLNVAGNTMMSSNLTVSGNATVSSNLTVGGDLQVAGSVTSNLHLTSNLEVGTANLFVDTTTSNVGIGTNAPLAALDVRGVAQFGLISNSGGVASVYNSGSWTTGTEIELGTLDWEKYKFHQIRCRFVGTNSTFQRYNARIRVRLAGESSFKTSGYESFASLLRVTSSTTLHSAYNGGDGPLVAYFSDTDHPGADAFIIIDICNTLNGRGQIQINGSYTYGTVGYTRVIAGCHHVSAGTYDKIKLYFEQFDGNNTATSSYGDWVLIGYR
jgi:cytoskeletal protein CcmA (bactofilin family)